MTDRDDRFCPVDDLRAMMCDAFVGIGTAEADAEFLVRSILASELSGHACHGVRRFPEYIARWRDGHADPAAKMIVEKDTGPIVVADGQRAFGHLFLRDVTELAIDRARRHGICMISGKGSEAAGRIADYCERGAEAGVAVLFFVNDSGGGQAVAPPGGTEARISTNPVAFGIPRAQPPHLVLDMATSAVAHGRLNEAQDRGEPIPDDWVNAAGVLKHFGGVKGFGLGLIAEALSGALSGGGTVGPTPRTDGQSFLLIAVDVAQVRPLDSFTAEVEAFIAYIRDVPLEAGAPPVRMPGEAGLQVADRIEAEGVRVHPTVLGRIRDVLLPLGIGLPPALQ